MDDAAPTPEPTERALPVPAVPSPTPEPEKRYEGNSYDLYALIAGIVGITSLGLCFSGNMLLYCLPLIPLVLGIVALRNSSRSLDPSRTRTLGWIGVGAGTFGIAILVLFALFMVVYLTFIFSLMSNFMQNMPQR